MDKLGGILASVITGMVTFYVGFGTLVGVVFIVGKILGKL